jgi:hypothetical protein
MSTAIDTRKGSFALNDIVKVICHDLPKEKTIYLTIN